MSSAVSRRSKKGRGTGDGEKNLRCGGKTAEGTNAVSSSQGPQNGKVVGKGINIDSEQDIRQGKGGNQMQPPNHRKGRR